MVFSALSFLAGLLLVQQFSILPAMQWLVVGGILAGIMAWLGYWRWLIFVLGLLWAILFAQYRLADQLSATLEGLDIKVTGIITDLPEQDAKQARFNFTVTEATTPLPSQLRLSWYYPDQAVKALLPLS